MGSLLILKIELTTPVEINKPFLINLKLSNGYKFIPGGNLCRLETYNND